MTPPRLSATLSPPSDSAIARFVTKFDVDHETGCWEWTACTSPNGYGKFWGGDRMWQAHRFSVLAAGLDIPDGLEIDHLCRNPGCVNPDHLEPVTGGENVRRWSRLVTHCPQGHPYDEANTYIRKSGTRMCRACKNQRRHELYMRPRVVAAAKIGRPLTSNDIVRYLNGDKKDHRPENLEVISRSEHGRRNAAEYLHVSREAA